MLVLRGFIAWGAPPQITTNHCLTWSPWPWSGCTVPVPWDAGPKSLRSLMFSWFWPFCSETRFWSAARWGRAPGRGSACAPRSGIGSPETQLSTAGAVLWWRLFGVACPLCSVVMASWVSAILALDVIRRRRISSQWCRRTSIKMKTDFVQWGLHTYIHR